MDGANIFTSLSAYHPSGNASPFENYCTSGLAYLLRAGNPRLSALLCAAAGLREAPISEVAVQPQLGGASIADMVLTFSGGARVLVEVEVEGSASRERLRALVKGGSETAVRVALEPTDPEPGVPTIGWPRVAEALADDPDRVAREFSEFLRRDVLGLDSVTLEDALRTNQLYALGGAALRNRFGAGMRYENSSSPPIEGRYRYLGTTFAAGADDLDHWIGIVNEGLPLSEHYHLMLASKRNPLVEPAGQPRVTGNWKWEQWTGLGRVVRPVGLTDYSALLDRMAPEGSP